MQWVPKLKKAHKSALITINNGSSLYLELVKSHEEKGKWRRKPQEMIHPKTSTQFGVESKSSLHGYCHYSVEGFHSNIEFSWSFEKDKPVISLNLPAEFTMLEQSAHDRSSEKFSDIVFDIKEIATPESTAPNGESIVSSNELPQTLSNSSASSSSILSDLVNSNKFKMEDSSE
jgi:hypothetical protein